MEEGLLEELSDEVREALLEIVGNLLKTEDYKIHSEAGSKKGDNFIGVVHRIKFSTTDGNNSSSLFLKMAPTNEERRTTLNVHDCFKRETYAYEVILPYFREFQESRNVFEDGFYQYPRCYKAITTERNECLFFQDMAQEDFIMIDKNKVTFEHVLMVMKTLGHFHAISFAMRDQEPEKLSELVDELREIFFIRGADNRFSRMINMSAINAINCITDDSDAKLMQILFDIYETNQYDLIADQLVGSVAEPYAVISHGDIWSNNTMFKYDDNNRLQDICLIDWQLARYCSPVLDLMYYIFSSTTRELRGRNYNIYLKTYYESLSSLLTRLGSDPEKLFPLSAFQEQLRKFGKYGLLNATFLLPMQVAEMNPEDNPDGVGELSDEFKKRVRDIIADSYRLGYI